MKDFLVILLLGACQLVLGQNITDVPLCAQTCLANATSAQTECTGIDVSCLCTNPDYVNALSCCLSTACAPSDQQKAIAFNMASCAAVNESAPNFVGCSPGVSDSAVLSFDTASLTSQTTTSGTSSPTTTTNSLVTTVTGAVESALTTLIGTTLVTANFNGRPLLTGTCSRPYFAQVTDSMGMVTQFPQMGCSPSSEGCCPFGSRQNAVLPECPQDYFTTASACCPSGWEVYFTDFGGQIPCFSMPTITHVPSSTPIVSGITVITEHVFTRKYELSDRALKGSNVLSTEAITGIAVGAVAGIAILGALIFFCLRRRKAQRVPQKLPTVGGGEMLVASPTSATHELASPHNVPNSPGSGRSAWISPSSPPAYERNVDPFRTKARQVAQELPGSTFIFEHHPAYTGQEDKSATAAPSSPPRTPDRSSPKSPHAKTTSSPVVVSPLGSPLQR